MVMDVFSNLDTVNDAVQRAGISGDKKRRNEAIRQGMSDGTQFQSDYAPQLQQQANPTQEIFADGPLKDIQTARNYGVSSNYYDLESEPYLELEKITGKKFTGGYTGNGYDFSYWTPMNTNNYGVYKTNPDGSQMTDSEGQPISATFFGSENDRYINAGLNDPRYAWANKYAGQTPDPFDNYLMGAGMLGQMNDRAFRGVDDAGYFQNPNSYFPAMLGEAPFLNQSQVNTGANWRNSMTPAAQSFRNDPGGGGLFGGLSKLVSKIDPIHDMLDPLDAAIQNLVFGDQEKQNQLLPIIGLAALSWWAGGALGGAAAGAEAGAGLGSTAAGAMTTGESMLASAGASGVGGVSAGGGMGALGATGSGITGGLGGSLGAMEGLGALGGGLSTAATPAMMGNAGLFGAGGILGTGVDFGSSFANSLAESFLQNTGSNLIQGNDLGKSLENAGIGSLTGGLGGLFGNAADKMIGADLAKYVQGMSTPALRAAISGGKSNDVLQAALFGGANAGLTDFLNTTTNNSKTTNKEMAKDLMSIVRTASRRR